MRILMLGMGSGGGGLDRYFHDLRAALARDHDVATVLADETPLPRRLARYARRAGSLARRADVVNAHFALYAAPPLLAGRLRRRPLVVNFQGPWAYESLSVGESGLRVAAKKRIERAVYRRADALVVLSREFRRILVDDYGVDPSRISVIPPAIDLTAFTPGDRASARERLGLDPAERVVATVRRLVPRMGLDVLLDAWDGTLLVAGDGPARADLERRAGPKVRFLGRVPDETLLDVYRAADVVAVPSLGLEGFGLVVLEALACGTPVVASATGGMGEALPDLDPRLLVPPGDAAALRERLADPELPDAATCREFAERFDWGRTAAAVAAVFERARRPRVVFLDHYAGLSGAEISLARLIPALGVDAHVILGEDGPLAGRLREAGATVEVLPLGDTGRVRKDDVTRPPLEALTGTAAYVRRLAARLRELRPDVVHTNSLKAAMYGTAAARLARVPVLWHARDRIAADYLPAAAVPVVRASARLADAVVANSAATLATLGVRGIVVPEPLPAMHVIRRPHDGVVVGMVGRLAPWKGQEVFLRALAEVPEPVTARVVGSAMFGEDAYAGSLPALARSLGVEVEFRGFREDVAAELAEMDVLVHCSLTAEPFGQVVTEGMAAGLAVVAAAAGGPAEVVDDGRTGLLVPPGDVSGLAAVISRLARDPELRERLGEAAREASAAYEPEEIARRVRQVYAQISRRAVS